MLGEFELANNNLIVRHYAGSRAYGTQISSSAVEIRGVFCAPAKYTCTPFFDIDTVTSSGAEATVYHEAAKFLTRVVAQDTQFVETLWIDRDDLLLSSEAYERLRAARDQLLTRHFAERAAEQARSLLVLMTQDSQAAESLHTTAPPQKPDYLTLVQGFDPSLSGGFDAYRYRDNHRLIPFSADLFGLYAAPGQELFTSDFRLTPAPADDTDTLEAPLGIIWFNRAAYQRAKQAWRDSWDLRKRRLGARLEDFEAFGFNTKAALHAVRLVRMGYEMLETSRVAVRRPDAEELLDVRAGKWAASEVIEYVEDMAGLIATSGQTPSPLPLEVSLDFAAELLLDLQRLARPNE